MNIFATRTIRLATIVTIALLNAPPLVRADFQYTVTDLGNLGQGNSIGYGVNNSGQVAGYGFASGSGQVHAFLSGPRGGMLQDLGSLAGAGEDSQGYGVNNLGQVVGISRVTAGGGQHAFLSGPNGGTLRDLGDLGGGSSIGYGVNDAGQVVGSAAESSGNHFSHAFISGPNGGALRDLGTLGGFISVANGINASGQVTGYSTTVGTNFVSAHAFFSGPNGGSLKDLGTLGGSHSEGTGVNSSGQVVGGSYLNGDNIGHAFLSGPNGGVLKDLGSFGLNSNGLGVNASGQVVGYADTSLGNHAFLYTNGSMIDLNTLIDPSSNFTLVTASSISDNGYITGSGSVFAGNATATHAFLLTPTAVPEPSAFILTALGALALTFIRRRSS